jgi:hypothetical protein
MAPSRELCEGCNFVPAQLSAEMSRRKGPPNYQVLAQHVLQTSDTWQQPEMLADQPGGRVHALTALIETCFGPDSAEAIARDLIIELDEFDLGDPDDPDSKPTPAERQEFLAKWLRNEFDDDAS